MKIIKKLKKKRYEYVTTIPLELKRSRDAKNTYFSRLLNKINERNERLKSKINNTLGW